MTPDDIKAAARRLAEEPLARGLKSQALHEYQDEQGNALFWVARLKDPGTGEKWIRPIRVNGQGYVLGKPHFQEGAPLYTLPDIAAHPDAVIWVVEGEWPADNLNKKFKQLGVSGQHVATTSGAATSAGSANWRALQGREVWIWPDNDGPGFAYARDVAAQLRNLHCRVQQIDIGNLGLPEHGDAVDWLGAHPDTAIDALLSLPRASVATDTPPSDSDDSPRGPPRLRAEALHGVLTDIVNVARKNSEATAVAVAANTLAWFCAMVGRAPFQWVGDGVVHCRPFFLIVGNSAKSRKGTAEKLPRRIFKRADEILADRVPGYAPLVVHGGGLSSGEGVGHAIRDASDTTDKDGHPRDPGVLDKRLIVIEPEFAGVLANCRRETSTLSPVIRNIWDGRDLAPLTKNNRTRATNPHVVLIGHITGFELVERIQQLEISNGLLNRFLVCFAQRDKLVPLPEPTPPEEIERLAARLASAVEFASGGQFGACDTVKVMLSEEARLVWTKLYPEISRDIPGITGELTARSEVYVRMLAMIFALLDASTTIEPQHLRAAIYWVDYVTESVSYIFRATEEERALDELEAAAQQVLEVVGRLGTARKTDISNAFGRHKPASQLDELLNYLLEGTPPRLESVTEKTAGRPRTLYRLRANEAAQAK